MPRLDNLEVVTVSTQLCDSSVTFCMVYASPNASVDYYNLDLTSYLANYNCPPNLHPGDFNSPDINWSTHTGTTSTSNDFCECVFESQLVESPNSSTVEEI